MNISVQKLFSVVVLLSLVGCECQRRETSGVSGELQWEWETADGPRVGDTAHIQFLPTAMGSRVERNIYLRNIGKTVVTASEFAVVTGTVTLNSVVVPDAAFELKWDATTELKPDERTLVTASFAPPVTQGMSVDYTAELQLKPTGAELSTLTLNGRAIAGQCDLPDVIDFGSVPTRSTRTYDLSVRNDGAAPVTAIVGDVRGVVEGIFTVSGITNGQLRVDPETAPVVTITFSPTVAGDFSGLATMRRAEQCPQKQVVVQGRGVSSCLSWFAEPSDTAQGLVANFGSVLPGSSRPGSVTWSNTCSLDVEIASLGTTDTVFSVTSATTVTVPAAVRDPMGTWVNGTAVTALAFAPDAIGSKTAQLLGTTMLASQPVMTVALKGLGGGPRIDIRPSPTLSMGRIGFTPGQTTAARSSLRVSNVGNRPTPPDVRNNLFLGANGQGPTYFSVRTVQGSDSELCVGDWDAATGTCTNAVSAYSAASGLEAIVGAGLTVPIRVAPTTAGQKEWEVTFFSNDASSPETVIRITADAVEAPPCQYLVSPTTLNFGLVNPQQVSDLSFTVTNRGVAANERCYLSGFRFSPTADPMFSFPTAPVDIELAPGQSTTITVRAAPTTMPASSQRVTDEVLFNISSPTQPNVLVQLEALVAPTCLSLTPAPLAFRDTELECGSPAMAVVVTNTCATVVTLNTISLTDPGLAISGAGSCTTPAGCPQFAITSALTLGTLQPGASRAMTIRFRPYVTGPTTGEVTVVAQQGTAAVPYRVALSGNGIVRSSAQCSITAACPPPVTVSANTTVPLATTVTSPGPVTCAWSAQMRPTTSNGTFGSASSCTSTTYFADVVGTHLLTFNVVDGLGGSDQCTTPVTVTPSGDLWIELTWDRDNDMDLHLLHPNAGLPSVTSSWFNSTWDCYFSNRTPTWGTNAQNNPSLDRDDIPGRGPENTRINTPLLNTSYTIGVHMFSYAASPNPVTSTVRVYCGGSLITTQSLTMSRVKDMWILGGVSFTGAGTCLFTPNQTVINVP
ncbi:MAG: choice-of-anchor D domain-containing protein [Archangium sp.]|nr:choice-of-anchor D domain-containing protein [Archangium sp.]